MHPEKENPSRLALLSAMMNGTMCRFWPTNWHTPVDGVPTSLSLKDGNRYLYNVEIAYHSHDIVQTVKLQCEFDRIQTHCVII